VAEVGFGQTCNPVGTWSALLLPVSVLQQDVAAQLLLPLLHAGCCPHFNRSNMLPSGWWFVPALQLMII
jgi:hypothetical protein